jgi:hypothetical protein
MQIDGGPAEMKGFHVSRYVQAASPVDAAKLALELVRKDRRLTGQLGVRLEVAEVREADEDPVGGNLSGFAFYDVDQPPN